MLFHPHLENSGLGFLAFLGLLIVMITETALKHVIHDPTVMAPRSWWLMSGYVAAAAYCVLLHLCIKWRESRLGYESPGADHKLARLPIRYWSIFYLLLGFLRVAAKE